MKAARVAASGLLLLGILSLIGIPAGEASDYLGQFCWQGPNGSVAKVAVTLMGNGHFLLNGRMTEANGNLEPFVGSAEVSGSNVYMTTASTGGDSSQTWTFIGRFVLSLSTLNGSGEIMGVAHSKTNPNPENTSLDYNGPFTFTFIPCP